MKASSLCFKAAVVLVVIGMVWGIAMAISDDHTTFPAHAHLNLLGWVSLFLFGIYYRLHPAFERSKLALTQVWAWIAGTLIQAIGVAVIFKGMPQGEAAAAAGSIIVLLSMLMFGWQVFHAGETSTRAVAQPAE